MLNQFLPGITPQPELSDQQIEMFVLMEAICQSDAGISFLQKLCRVCGWSRSTQSNEQSAQRDIWIHFRTFMPADKLPLIENEDIRERQRGLKELQREMEIAQRAREAKEST
ncbi:MAG: hypothetical protein KGL39_23115 [Patescibacteria group bacterium]|nr:hypothetical protein [Patescibacteria group bacterium]